MRKLQPCLAGPGSHLWLFTLLRNLEMGFLTSFMHCESPQCHSVACEGKLISQCLLKAACDFSKMKILAKIIRIKN